MFALATPACSVLQLAPWREVNALNFHFSVGGATPNSHVHNAAGSKGLCFLAKLCPLLIPRAAVPPGRFRVSPGGCINYAALSAFS